MKKKYVLLGILIFVIVAIIASLCFNIYWCDKVYKSFLAMGGYGSLHQEQTAHIVDLATRELEYFYGFLTFGFIQFFSLIGSIYILIYILKTDFSLTREERNLKAQQIADQRKQTKKEKLQAQLDELNKE